MFRILVVDDSKLSRGFLTRPLRAAGHEVCEATNGLEGLDCYRGFSPDCVITDVRMPIMDGPTMLAELRQESEVPVIVVSTEIQQSTRSFCEALGIRSFLHKPIKATDLLKALESEMNPSQSA